MKKSQVMEAMRLTLDEHHRKVRVSICDISDWLVNADVSDLSHHPRRSRPRSRHNALCRS